MLLYRGHVHAWTLVTIKKPASFGNPQKARGQTHCKATPPSQPLKPHSVSAIRANTAPSEILKTKQLPVGLARLLPRPPAHLWFVSCPAFTCCYKDVLRRLGSTIGHRRLCSDTKS